MSVANIMALVAPLVAPGGLILAQQNGNRPPKPYATLDIRTTLPARPYQREPNTAGITELVQQLYRNCELQFFGVNALATAELTGLRLRFPSVSSRAEVLGIGVARVANALRVPELLNQSQYEERAVLEFSVYDAIVASDDVGLIEGVEIECFDHTHLVSKPTAP